jgi:transposase
MLPAKLEIEDMRKKLTFMGACRDYFGAKEGQTNVQFGKEVQALTPAERAEIQKGLEQQGYEIMAAPGLGAVKEAALA